MKYFSGIMWQKGKIADYYKISYVLEDAVIGNWVISDQVYRDIEVVFWKKSDTKDL